MLFSISNTKQFANSEWFRKPIHHPHKNTSSKNSSTAPSDWRSKKIRIETTWKEKEEAEADLRNNGNFGLRLKGFIASSNTLIRVHHKDPSSIGFEARSGEDLKFFWRTHSPGLNKIQEVITPKPKLVWCNRFIRYLFAFRSNWKLCEAFPLCFRCLQKGDGLDLNYENGFRIESRFQIQAK